MRNLPQTTDYIVDRIYELELLREALRTIGKLTDEKNHQITAELRELRRRLLGTAK